MVLKDGGWRVRGTAVGNQKSQGLTLKHKKRRSKNRAKENCKSLWDQIKEEIRVGKSTLGV